MTTRVILHNVSLGTNLLIECDSNAIMSAVNSKAILSSLV